MPSEKQINRWVLAATIPPLIMTSAGISWAWLLIATLLCGAAVYLGKCAPMGRWGGILQWAAAVVALSILLPEAQQCWPTDPHPAVPLILLALATWAAGKGIRAAAGVGCVLFWFIIIMYSAMFTAMIPEVQVRNMIPAGASGSWLTILLLMIPAAPLITGREKRAYAWLPGIVTGIAALMTGAVLSGNVSGNVPNPFYEAVRSVRLRLEPILGAAATVGWFLLLTVLLSVSGERAAQLQEKIRIPAILVTATIATVILLCGLPIPAWIGAIFAAISWVFLPRLTQFLEGRKKMKKSEKNP